MTPLTIGEVARRAGIGVETVRFYEREGLLERPARRESGYRQYGDDVVRRPRFIKRAKELGFSLKEVKELIALRLDPDAQSAEVKRRAEDKIAEIDGRARDLLRMKDALLALTAACRGEGPVADCPILNALDPPGVTPAPGRKE